MASVDSLSIQITASTASAKEKVDALVKSLNALVTAINGIDASKIDALASSTNNLANGLAGLKGTNIKTITKIGDALNDISTKGTTALEPVVQSAEKLTEETAAITEEAGKVSEGFASIETATLEDVSASAERVSSSIDRTSERMSRFKMLLSNLKIIIPTEGLDKVNSKVSKLEEKIADLKDKINYGKSHADFIDDAELEKDQKQLQGLINELDRLKLKQQELASHGGFKLNSAFSSAFAGFEKNVATVNRKLGGMVSNLFHVGKSSRSAGKSMFSFKLSADKLVKSLTRVTKMLRLMVLRMALRKVIKEVGDGFKSLALHSEEFDSTMSNLMNSAKKLGYSFSAMVAPLLQALAPALIYIINLLTKAMNAVNQLFSVLSGKGTYNKAKDFTGKWSDDIKAANKEAKEFKKTVLGFDELNQLQEKTKSGGGDTSGNITDMFETVPIDKKWKDIADWLKKMWQLGDFYELGKKLGEKLRDMLESIPWDLIRKTANKLGKSLATLINGFVEVERLGYDIGKTIAQSVNTVFEFLNGFVHNLHWDSIGKFIADTFNGFFENIDWALIKDTVVTGMAGIAEAIQNFIDNFHWDNLSDFVINAVDTISSGVKAFVEGIDWLDLGVKIGDQINKVMEGIDWHDVGDTLGAVLEAAIDWAYGLVTTFSVDDAVNAIQDFLKGVCERVDAQKAGEALGTALHKLIEVIKKFWWNEENRRMIKEEIIGFFRGIFNTMDASDFAFVATSVGALALLKSLKGMLGKGALTVTVSLAVAYLGFTAGSWLGKILTGDPAYDTYDINATLNWVVENFPTSIDEAIERLKELRQAWWDMLYEADNIITKVLKIANLIANPSSWPQFLGRFAKDKGWEGIDIGGSGGSGANAEADEWQKTIEAAKEATENAIRYKSEALPLWNGSGGSGANVEEAEWKKTIEAASQASKMTYTYKNEAQDASNKTKMLWETGATSTRDYSKEVEGLTEKQKQLKGIMSPLVTDANNLTTNYGKLKTETGSLKTALDNANTAYKNVKTGMETNVSYTPVLTSSMQDIDNHLKTLGQDTDTFTATNKTDWTNVQTDVANAGVGFAGTMKEIQKGMNDTSKDLTSQTEKISKSFSKDKWTFSGVADGLKKTFEDAKNGIKNVWNSIADKLNGEYEIGNGHFRINLPRFALGGFPDENGIFMANSSELVGKFSNGKTAVANNAEIVEGISAGVYNAVSSAMAKGGSGNDRYIANTIVVDGEVIARTVTKAQQRQQMRYSPSLV